MIVIEDFVSIEQAKRLKAFGFKQSLSNRLWYLNDGNIAEISPIADATYRENVCCVMPTLAQACKWLREKHNIHIQIESVIGKRWTYCLVDINCRQDISGEYISRIPERDGYPVIDTYEQAQSAGIDTALSLIEEEGGEANDTDGNVHENIAAS